MTAISGEAGPFKEVIIEVGEHIISSLFMFSLLRLMVMASLMHLLLQSPSQLFEHCPSQLVGGIVWHGVLWMP